jgi:hypothetical protein
MAEQVALHPPTIAEVLRVLHQHAAIRKVGSPESLGEEQYRITVDMEVELPSRAKASGVSSSGVRQVEPVTLDFGPGWPFVSPKIGLRADFPLNLPHINPHTPGELVRPCVFQGAISELLHRQGLDGILDQISDWLSKAAGNNLIDLQQGWEPTRRDDAAGTMVFSASQLISLLPVGGNLILLPTVYGIIDRYHFVNVSSTPEPRFTLEFLQKSETVRSSRLTYGNTYTFVAVAPHQEGAPQEFDQYEPETVKTLRDLLDKAGRLGIDSAALLKSLESFHQFSQQKGKVYGWSEGFQAGIILAVHRPAALIGSPGQKIELLPYLLTFRATTRGTLLDRAVVTGCRHENSLSPELLARTSGLETVDITQPITLIGCGSLGSKIGLHLGRAGFGQLTFVDDDWFSTHNSARHALLPPKAKISPNKAAMMQSAFNRLGHTGTQASNRDAAVAMLQEEGAKQILPQERSLIIDASASLKVLEASCHSPALSSPSRRLVRVALYGQGNSCVMMLEGINRTARVDDLQAYLFSECRRNPELRQQIAGTDTAEPVRFFVGQNCSSVTTLMSDSRISRAAAMATLQLEAWFQSGFPPGGSLCLGLSDAEGVGMTWQLKELNETTMLDVADHGGWEVRLLKPVIDAINADVENWGELETGGALLGHISQARRCLIVTDIVPAPPDSRRSRSEFVLGKDGLEDALRTAHADSLAHLHFIGTWHSHPMGGRHSRTDFKTLDKIAESAGGLPALSLIWTPGGFECAVKAL